ncbi:helix-turn-helix transcriptional regulator [Paraburkholderia aromaticivorans]|uniref:helix-turn-helix transcriptional regulator n=1 Tax=Paraburkholderia aromaticivorans TaxID=2026199 RepID=UPI001F0E4A57|nr:AlpA family phage regulatory protein [Paraburkholderia aromaticivorans]
MTENPLFAAFFAGFRPARQRERFSHTIFRALEARNECAMQDVGGGSSAPSPVRAPRTQRRTPARKPASEDGDSDSEPRRSHVRPLFLDLKDVAATVSLSTGGIQALVREGSFPKPRELSARRVGWLFSEVEQWAISRPVASMLPPVNAGIRSAA